MPQAPKKLQDKFPDYDREALEVLRINFIVARGGIIRPKKDGYAPTDRENDAIDYLFLEWDYAYIPVPEKSANGI